jgi:2-dehydropantoate 2-reductase
MLNDEVDILFVATKALTLESARQRVHAQPQLVVPLLNGLDHLELLRRWFGAERVAAAVIRIESTSTAPGQIVQTSPFLRVDLAADDPALHARIEPVAEVLERAGIPTRIESSEAQAMWSKLVRLSALALTTSASGETIGFIRSDPVWRPRLTGAIGEVAAVANADGASIDPVAALAELDEAHPELRSSMQRDIAAGQEPELDAIAGAVLRAARRHGIACPTVEELGARVAERAGLARGPGVMRQGVGGLGSGPGE